MHTDKESYLKHYLSLNMTRDARGILTVAFHSNGGPLNFSARDHTDFVDAFYRISQDRANKVVIFTGTGGDFISGIDFSSFGNVADPEVLEYSPDSRGFVPPRREPGSGVPVIAAVEGRLNVHSEYALIANANHCRGRRDVQ